jgi:HD-GYP domain-containing protein (c-di-GMP phosphodiesterase class II)
VSAQIEFLHGIAHALATLTLYAPDHPACAGVVEGVWLQLKKLQEENPGPRYSFLKDAVIYGNLPLHDLKNWTWSKRLSEIGIQRLEVEPDVTREGFIAFLVDVTFRLPGHHQLEGTMSEHPGIRWGSVGVKGQDKDQWADAPQATIGYKLGEEADVMRWVYERAALTGDIPRDEVETVVASLSVAMQADVPFLMPLLQLTDQDEYRTMHALNVSLLTMTLAESLGMGSQDIHGFGVAGLLHDIGISRVPKDLLHKQSLNADDREVLENHPAEGARILLARKGDFDLAAVVAYEHHIRPDGKGYPHVPSSHEVHYASKIVTVCDVYDALRTTRSHRPAWDPAQAVTYIEEGAGTVFDAGVARAFASMLRRLDTRNALVPRGGGNPQN